MFQKIFSIKLPTIYNGQKILPAELPLFPSSAVCSYGYDDTRPFLMIQEPLKDNIDLANTSYCRDDVYVDLKKSEHECKILKGYVDVFLAMVPEARPDWQLLEIGCGTGSLLREFRKLGIPGLVGCEGAGHALDPDLPGDIKVFGQNFTAGMFAPGQFDCIVAKTVFEHIPRIEDLLKEVEILLRPGGVLFFSVPDCSQEMILGDPRILALQHFNYFTKESAEALMIGAGFSQVSCRNSRNTQDLFIAARKNGKIAKNPVFEQKFNNTINIYAELMMANLDKLQMRIDKLSSSGKSIGIYGYDPNLALLLDWKKNGLRMFDSSEQKWGIYYKIEANAIVEPPLNILKNPVDEIWIAPIHYDLQIKNYIINTLKLQDTISVLSLRKFYEENINQIRN